jgi:purine-binding chemotaxis protein CheW
MAQETTGVDSRLLTLLVLRVAGQRLAVPAADVVEILPAMALLPLADSPASFEGLARVRGATVPVLGARARLGLPHRPMATRDHLVVCRVAGRQVALHVDRVVGLRDYPVDPLDRGELPMMSSAIGIATDADGAFMVHDLAVLCAPGALEAAAPEGLAT